MNTQATTTRSNTRWKKNLLASALSAILVMGLSACDGEGGSNSSLADSDGGGGSNSSLADSDGDGISDVDEINLYHFDADNNNYSYNPLISDLPEIAIHITSVPDIKIYTEASKSEENAVSVSRTTETSKAVTTSETSSNSISVEESHSAGASVTVDSEISWTPSASVSGTVSYDYTHSTTNEQSFSWTEEQTRQNSLAFEEYESKSQTTEITSTSVDMAVTLQVTNPGNRSFTVSNLVLGAYIADPVSGRVLKVVDNLELSSESGFSAFSLGPNESTGNLTFVTGDLSLALGRDLLVNSSGLIIEVSSYDIKDENGVSYSFVKDEVIAKTATVIIDYSGELPTERYNVSTITNPGSTIHAVDAFDDILSIPLETDQNTGQLVSVRDVWVENNEFELWVVLHKSSDGVNETLNLYKSNDPNMDFDAITLKPGDVLHLVKIYDEDEDGLGARQESLYGTDPQLKDTDFDERTDFEEAMVAWDVSVNDRTTYQVFSSGAYDDADNDGLNDAIEKDNNTDPFMADTDNDGLDDNMDSFPTVTGQYRVADLHATANTDTLDSEFITVEWTPVASDPTLVRQILVRQIADESFNTLPLPAIAANASLEDLELGQLEIDCGANSTCEVVYVGLKDVGLQDQFKDTDVADGMQYRYVHFNVFAQDDETRYLRSLNPVTASINVPTVTYTITFNSFFMEKCIDAGKPGGEYDWDLTTFPVIPGNTCELFYKIQFGDQTRERNEANKVEVENGKEHLVKFTDSTSCEICADNQIQYTTKLGSPTPGLAVWAYESDSNNSQTLALDDHGYSSKWRASIENSLQDNIGIYTVDPNIINSMIVRLYYDIEVTINE